MAGQTAAAELQRRLHDAAMRLNLSGSGPWSAAPALGIVWRTPAGPGVRSFLYQELRSRLVRRLPSVGRVPVRGASPSGRLASRLLKAQTISGPDIESTDALLVVGRRRSKLLDFKHHTATGIESGENSSIRQEVAARQECGEGTTTAFLYSDTEAGVFVERLERGFNLAVYGTAVRWTPDVIDLLTRWRANRSRVISAREHIQTIELELGEASSTSEWSNIRAALPMQRELVLDLSHGDLQAANVLAGVDGLRLVDFEHLDWRAKGYDVATFSKALRWRRPPPETLDPWMAAEEFRWRVRTNNYC